MAQPDVNTDPQEATPGKSEGQFSEHRAESDAPAVAVSSIAAEFANADPGLVVAAESQAPSSSAEGPRVEFNVSEAASTPSSAAVSSPVTHAEF